MFAYSLFLDTIQYRNPSIKLTPFQAFLLSPNSTPLVCTTLNLCSKIPYLTRFEYIKTSAGE